MPSFVPGLELCRRFYVDAVAPILTTGWPGLDHTAARIGAGSEVLGFDTERSADHDWGPHLLVLLRPDDAERSAGDITAALRTRLPAEVAGWSTHFAAPHGGNAVLTPADGPIDHRVVVTDLGRWLVGQLGVDPRAGLSELDWLGIPTQKIAETVGGAVFHDGIGELSAVRNALRWYPDDVWRYVLAAQWTRISQEEAFVGRTAEVGDDLGSAVVAARLVRDLMRLWLLMARRWAPYSKWLGSVLSTVEGVAPFATHCASALVATTFADRETALSAAYAETVQRHNELGLTAPFDATTSWYHDRPFQVVHADRFAAALRAGIADPALAALPPVGAVDQFADSTDVLSDPARARAMTRGLFARVGGAR